MIDQKVNDLYLTKSRRFYGYTVIIAASCIMVAAFGTRFAFGVFFQPILTEFAWTRAMTSGAFSISTLMEGLLGIVMGGLNDRFGPRVVLTLCGIFLGLGYFLMSRTTTLWQLYLFYGLLIGTGMGGIWVPLVSTVARWFIKRRSMMTGIAATGIGIGTLIAPPVSNWLITHYDWRVSYIMLGSLVLVVVVLSAQLLRRDPAKMGQLPYGENNGSERESLLATGGFSLREAVHTGQFWVVCAMFFCYGFFFFAVMVHVAPHAIDLGFSATNAANILATIGGLVIIGRVILGNIADRIGNRQIYTIGFILMSAALFWLVPSTNMWMLYLFAAALGVGHGGMGATGSPLVAGLFGLRSHGLIFGVMVLSYTIGGAFGPSLVGYIFDVTGGYQIAFLVCAIIGVIGLALTILLKQITHEHTKTSYTSN